MSRTQGRTLLLLHILLLFYSLSDVMSKLAAGFDFLSLGFVVCYGGLLVILAGYAIGWQQVIKRMPLTTAYANRGITVVWGIFWGALFFSEAVMPGKIAGAVMVVAGIVLFSLADGEAQEEAADGE